MARDFDPIAILAALERHRVAYVVVGDLAGVIHGTGLTTRSVEIAPSLKAENLERLAAATAEMGAPARSTKRVAALDAEPNRLALGTERGEIVLTRTPEGTRGYDDLRRGARREPLGRGVRAPVASLPDLIRSIDARGREQDRALEQRLRRAAELEPSLSPEL